VSLVIKGRINARGESVNGADALHVRLRGIGPHQVLHFTLVEDDGTSWQAAVTVDNTWSDRRLPLSAFMIAKSVLLPERFPGEWNYWAGSAAGRGGPGDHPQLDHLERLQFSLRSADDKAIKPGDYGGDVGWVTLGFARH